MVLGVNMDDAFKVLLKKDVYLFLQGDVYQNLVTYKGVEYGLPYRNTKELNDICRSFGITAELKGSRWTYVEALIQYSIENNRCDELLTYFFSLENFTNLEAIQDIEEATKLHNQIVEKAIKTINNIIHLSRKELVFLNGHYTIVEIGSSPVIQSPKINSINVPYIRGLKDRCEIDLKNKNYDSVITKSRTLIEETFLHILEQNDVVPNHSNIKELYAQVKKLRNMKQSNEFDNRINDLLNGLEKIVDSIATMRNINSDAHGVGKARIGIQEKEARLVMNSAITFCEYMLST